MIPRFLPLLALPLCFGINVSVSRPTALPAASALCAALKSHLGQAILLQKRGSDEITKLVSTLSDYAQASNAREDYNAYKTGWAAMGLTDDLEKTLGSLKSELELAQSDPGNGDSQTSAVAAGLAQILADQSDIAQKTGDLLHEWNSRVMLDTEPTSISHSGGGKGRPFAGFGLPGGSSSGIAVMDVRPLLLQTLHTMDDVAATLQKIHPLVVAGINQCRARHQAAQRDRPW